MAASSSSSSKFVKRFVASSIKRYLVPLIRPAADSPLIRLKMMTPGGSHSHLPLSSLPFFERDFYNRFPITRRFSHVILRWSDDNYREQLRGREWVDTPECLTIYMSLSGMDPDKVYAGFRHHSGHGLPNLRAVGHGLNFSITGYADLAFGYVPHDNNHHIGMFSLPEELCKYKVSDIKVEIWRNSGELKVTLPKVKPDVGYVNPNVIPESNDVRINATVIDDDH